LDDTSNRPGAVLTVYLSVFISLIAREQHFWCAMFDILVAAFIMLYLVPTADAYDRAHPHALRISPLNVFLGWTVFGWMAAFVWSRTISPVDFYAARNRPRRAVCTSARWAARLAVPRTEIGRELFRSARPSQTRTYGR
jgi:hypothetical protein